MQAEDALLRLRARVGDTRKLLADLEAQLAQLSQHSSPAATDADNLDNQDDRGEGTPDHLTPAELHAPPFASTIDTNRTSVSSSGLREDARAKSSAGHDSNRGESSSTLSKLPLAHQSGIANRPLPDQDYSLYARQLIVPEIGLHGHSRIRNARVLIVGLGGLGCPAAAYLAGAGVGTLALVDGDVVEESNLHRQIIHSASAIGTNKASSAERFIHRLNPSVRCDTFTSHLAPQSALSIVKNYDVVLDCTDHPASRYLVSDTCVLAGKPLISASALKTEGQLMLLNTPALPPGEPTGGPCYRCIFPKPPPVETVLSCGEAGIIGPVVGAMGVMQALEAIKLIASGAHLAADTPAHKPPARACPTLLMFSAYSSPQFRNVKLRPRRTDCQACSPTATVVAAELAAGSLDYTAFCGASEPVGILADSERITARECARRVADRSSESIIIDVRDETHYELCHLTGSVNVPIDKFSQLVKDDAYGDRRHILRHKRDICVICRMGNDSQIAVKALREAGVRPDATIRDVKGGFKAWRQDVDPKWPDY